MAQVEGSWATPIVISKQTARRFILVRQGLWPGRRWKGKKGTAQALRACEAVQLDPLNVVGRSQDIVLHSRVLDYAPEHLQQLLYTDREFFDYGGWLAVYPMSELPYWRVHMQNRGSVKRVEDFVFKHNGLFEAMRAELWAHGPLKNRDVEGKSVGSWNYRGRKDTSLALYLMWLSGELMIHHRDGFERVYDFRGKIVPHKSDSIVSEKEAEEFFARKSIAFKGLILERRWKTDLEHYLHRKIDGDEMRVRMKAWGEKGLVAFVKIDGENDKYLILMEDLPSIDLLELGKVPRDWNPIKSTTLDEVTFLAPLDIVIARGRAKKLFDFEYLWEVYKPPGQRRWGYFTLPVLYGDDLVARMDPVLDRATKTLNIKGFWLEDDAPAKEPSFSVALVCGLIRFAGFLDARRINIAPIRPLMLRQSLQSEIRKTMDVSVR